MLCWRSKSILSPFSLRTFVEHLPCVNFKPLNFPQISRKTLITASSLKSSHFETLNPQQKDQVSLYVDALLQWNQKMNLTAVTERSEVMERHIEDSLAIIPPIKEAYASHCGSSCESLNLVDVGSGAGLPGLILAIACPGWKVTLLESMKKRCLFLKHAVDVAGLSNVEVVRDRAENFGQTTEFRESYDVAVARAVAELRILVEYCLPLVRVGGLFVAAKGHDPQEEVINAERAISVMGASVLHQRLVESHSPLGQRTAVICFKDHTTPRKYPRDPELSLLLPLCLERLYVNWAVYGWHSAVPLSVRKYVRLEDCCNTSVKSRDSRYMELIESNRGTSVDKLSCLPPRSLVKKTIERVSFPVLFLSKQYLWT